MMVSGGITVTGMIDGENGYSTAVVQLFRRYTPTQANPTPALPTGTLTYTFSTGVLSGASASFNGWSQAIPAADGGAKLFVTMATARSQGATDTIAASEWRTPVEYVADGAQGTSPWVADLRNQMDSISCDDMGHPVTQQSVSSRIDMYHGSEAAGFTIDSVTYRNGTVVTVNAGSFDANGVKADYNNGTQILTITYSTSAQLTKDDFAITIVSGSVSRTVHFIVNAIIGDVYNLMPSADEIHAQRSGTDYVVDGSSTYNLTCGYTTKVNNQVTEHPDTNGTTINGQIDSKYNIYFRLRSRTSGWASSYKIYKNSNKGPLTSFNLNTYDAAEFLLSTSTTDNIASPANIIDSETVYVIADGTKGADGTRWQRVYKSTQTGSAAAPTDTNYPPDGWSASPTAITESQPYRMMSERSSDDGGTTWGEWSTPQIDAYLSKDGRSIDIKGSAIAVRSTGGSYPSSPQQDDIVLENGSDSDADVSHYDNGSWTDNLPDGTAPAVGDGYILKSNGHLWILKNDSHDTGRWEDAGQIQGPKGEDAVNIIPSPGEVIIPQNTTKDQQTQEYELDLSNAVTIVSVNKGGDPQSTFSIINLTGHYCTASLDQTDNHKIKIDSVDKHSGVFYDSGYVSFDVTYDGNTYQGLRFNFYCNLMGTWKEWVEGDTKTEVANMKYYVYDKDGHPLPQQQTVGEYIRSSSIATSTLTNTVAGHTTSISQIRQTSDSISLRVSNETVENLIANPQFSVSQGEIPDGWEGGNSVYVQDDPDYEYDGNKSVEVWSGDRISQKLWQKDSNDHIERVVPGEWHILKFAVMRFPGTSGNVMGVYFTSDLADGNPYTISNPYTITLTDEWTEYMIRFKACDEETLGTSAKKIYFASLQDESYQDSDLLVSGIRLTAREDSVMKEAGIDMGNGTIHMRADNTIIDSDVEVKSLSTLGEGCSVRVANGLAEFFGVNGVCNIRLGLDDDGCAILKFYNKDGVFMYDLGPSGIVQNLDGKASEMKATVVLKHAVDSLGREILEKLNNHANALSLATLGNGSVFYRFIEGYSALSQSVRRYLVSQSTTPSPYNDKVYDSDSHSSESTAWYPTGNEIAVGYYVCAPVNISGTRYSRDVYIVSSQGEIPSYMGKLYYNYISSENRAYICNQNGVNYAESNKYTIIEYINGRDPSSGPSPYDA